MIDWEIIKNEYLTTDTSYRKLSKKYDVSFSQLSARAKEEDWIKQKNDKAVQIGTDLKKLATDKTIEEFNQLLSIDKRLITLVDRKLKYYENLKDEKLCLLDYKTIKGLVTSVSGLTDNIRNLCGIPTQVELHSQQMAKERLEVEKNKVDMGCDTGEITIRYEGNIKELEEYGG